MISRSILGVAYKYIDYANTFLEKEDKFRFKLYFFLLIENIRHI